MRKSFCNTNGLGKLLLGGIVVLFTSTSLQAQTDSTSKKVGQAKTESKEKAPSSDTIAPVVTSGVVLQTLSAKFKHVANDVQMSNVNTKPFISLQQLVKGNLAGVYVQEPTGEPGADQNIFVRGISSPLLNKQALFDNQAVVFLNGIPLTRDNPFAYEIQQYDFNRIGPATNLLAAINTSNIESIELIKDPVTLAALGPIAANGAIWITTKNAKSGFREISVNTYFGTVLKPNITPINAAFENKFRTPFYNEYAANGDRTNYPTFLRDSTNADYYGPANWTDKYYKNSQIYSVDLSLTGGSERANFRFFAGATKNAGNADATSLDRYTGSFFINVAPVKWLMVSSMITYNRMDRARNRNIRDRLAEQRYLPDLTNPLTPNKELYSNYLNEFDKSIDKNITNTLQGYVALSANLNKVSYNGRIGFDYNEGTRDVFWPTTLLEKNNFVSNYFGYNQRFIVSNSLSYTFDLNSNGKLRVEGGQNFWADVYKYDYAYAYNGPNDFIKINVVNGNPGAEDYLQTRGFRVYYFPSRMQNKLASFYGNASWFLDDNLKISALVRRDGSSNMQPDNRWFTSYSAGAEYDIHKKVMRPESKISALSVTASWGRLGKLLNDDRFNAGPQYRVDLGWTGEPTIGSYAGIPGVSRPYSAGWVGYGIPWAYSDQLNVGVRLGLLQDRLKITADIYNRDDKQMLITVPVPAETGYTGAYKSGLEVNNKGVDLSILADILPEQKKGLSWIFTANANFNKNRLVALPGGIDEVILGANKLEVGKQIDAFWILQNEGIYKTSAEIPVNPATNLPLSYQGVALKAGDPRWKDTNGDYVINDKDKVLKGNYMPKASGGFGSNFGYKNFSLDVQFYFVLGRDVLNQYAATRLDFVNTESNNDINSVKEITYWEKKMDLSGYPVYNPWSDVVPYRQSQDLFLDDASFLKLRSLTLGYDLSKLILKKGNSNTVRKTLVYVTGTNLLTMTKFKGDDPELAGYNGIYNGYGLRIPASVIVGVKLDL